MKALPFLLFLLANASLLLAQSWRFEQYSVAEGLPQSQVFALLQDRRGYLWLGTQGGGLARFDGKSFRRFSQKDDLQGSYVNALLEDEAGNIWIATNKGVSRFDGRRFEHFELLKNGSNAVFAFTFDITGTLWLAGDAGIFSLKNDSIIHVTHVAGQAVGKLTAIFCDRSGNVWAGGGEGIFKLENGIWRHAWKRRAEVLSFVETADGQLLAGIFHLGVLRFDGKTWTILNKNQGLPSNKVQCLWQAPDSKIWVGTQDAGICIWDRAAGSFTYLTEQQGLCNANIHAILGDRWSNVWLGTSGGGACRYRPGRFEHFDAGNGLRSQFAYAVCKGDSGIWFTSDRGLSFYNYQTFRHFGAEEGFADVKCRALHLDRRGRLWIGTEGRGLAVLDTKTLAAGGSAFRFFSKRDGL
ncbi:MAG: two-component regulator propeller domain-containing protein, partial [Bacteroidota bacterium]